MATVTNRGITWNTNAGNKTVNAVPAVGDLLVVFCANSGRTSAQAPTITDDQPGGTYTQVEARTKNSSADSGWCYIRNALCASTSTHVVTQATSGDTGGGLIVFSVSGIERTGINAKRQATGANNQAGATTPSVTFGSALLTGNPTIGMVFASNNSNTTAVNPSGWTEVQDQGYNNPASGIETVSRNSGSTATTVTWGGATGTAYGVIMVEIDTAPARTVGFTITGGGVEAQAASTERSGGTSSTGGGVTTIGGLAEWGEEHEGSFAATGGGAASSSASTARQAGQALTGAGAVTLGSESPRSSSAQITGAGAASLGTSSERAGGFALTGGGQVLLGTSSPRLAGFALTASGRLTLEVAAPREAALALTASGRVLLGADANMPAPPLPDVIVANVAMAGGRALIRASGPGASVQSRRRASAAVEPVQPSAEVRLR